MNCRNFSAFYDVENFEEEIFSKPSWKVHTLENKPHFEPLLAPQKSVYIFPIKFSITLSHFMDVTAVKNNSLLLLFIFTQNFIAPLACLLTLSLTAQFSS
jgi:hypothetical protein